MSIRRSARKHAGISQEDVEAYWDFRPGQRVMTVDGFPGIVDEVQDGPYPGTEQYLVTLDGGMGGGEYSASDLSAVESTTAVRMPETLAEAMDLIASIPNEAAPGAKDASLDYPELAEILVTRPPLAHAEPLVMKASKTAVTAVPPVGDVWWSSDDTRTDAQCPVCGGNGQTIVSADGQHAAFTHESPFEYEDEYDNPWSSMTQEFEDRKRHELQAAQVLVQQGKVGAKTAAAYYLQTPESEALYDAASTVLSQASQAMATVEVPDSSIEDGTAYEIAKQRFAQGVMDEYNRLSAEAGMYDGIPQDIPPLPEWAILEQFSQYPQSGPDGVSYFKGEIDSQNHVDCLLYREGGKLLGVLNHYPKAMGPERKGNVLLLVLPEARRQGIGKALWDEAKKRWNVQPTGQDQTPMGRSFTDKHGTLESDAVKTDWAALHAYMMCDKCGFAGNVDPVTDITTGKQVDVCPACGDTTPYEAIDADGWLVEDDLTRAASVDKKISSDEEADEHVFFATAGLWDKVLNKGTDILNSQMKPEFQYKPGHNPSTDWCRFRKNERCLYPKTLNADATKQAGYDIWVPEDRGFCPRQKWEDQEKCPVSEAGPNSGDPDARVDATVRWEDGGQRGGLPDSMASLTKDAGFEVTASWADVRNKARRIRSEGGVRIISAPRPGGDMLTVTAEINGDTHVYETTLLREPGRHNVASWRCGCAWASYSWGRSPAFKRFEGRMCSHALALQYEAQSQGMFGKTIVEQVDTPPWRVGNDPFEYVKPERGHARAASKDQPLRPVYDDDHFDVAPLTYIAASGGLSATAAADSKVLDFGGKLKALVRGTIKGIKFLVLNDMHKWEVVDNTDHRVPLEEIRYPTYHPTRGLTLSAHAGMEPLEDVLGVTASAKDVEDMHDEHGAHHTVQHVEMPKGGRYPYDKAQYDPSQWGRHGWMPSMGLDAFLFEDGTTEMQQGDPGGAASFGDTGGGYSEAARQPNYLTLDDARAAALHDEPEPALPTTEGDVEEDELAFEASLDSKVAFFDIPDDLTLQQAAEFLIGQAKRRGDYVTNLLKDLASKHRGRMDRLETNVKEVKRTVEKMEKAVQTQHIRPDQAAEQFQDALRYTMVLPTMDYSEAVEEILRDLAGHGIRPMAQTLVKNYWLRGDPYDGVNGVFLMGDGFPFECQWHTDASLAVAEKNHDKYEEFRRKGTPAATRKRLWDEMVFDTYAIERPGGEANVGFHNRHSLGSTGPVETYYGFHDLESPGAYSAVFRSISEPGDFRFERWARGQGWVEDNDMGQHLVHGDPLVETISKSDAIKVIGQFKAANLEHVHAEALAVEALTDPATAPEMAEVVTESLASSPPTPGDPRLAWLMSDQSAGATGESAGGGNPILATDGDIAAQAKAHLAKMALKEFSPAEQQAIINEGAQITARNLSDLDLEGTHYSGLEAAFQAAEEDEEA